jgi:hypothetical protein
MIKFSNKNRRLSKVGAQAGFIKTILVIIAALVILKYVYNIDVVNFLTQGRFRDILDNIYRLGSEGWDKYKDALIKIWGYANEFVKNIFRK